MYWNWDNSVTLAARLEMFFDASCHDPFLNLLTQLATCNYTESAVYILYIFANNFKTKRDSPLQ